jgi:hypothetical protein
MEPAEFGRTAAVDVIVRSELEKAVNKLLAVLPASLHEEALRALGAGDGGDFPLRERGAALRVEFVKPERPDISYRYADGTELTPDEQEALAAFRARRDVAHPSRAPQGREPR